MAEQASQQLRTEPPQLKPPQLKPVVCFDIGGVLVQIRHTWDAVLAALEFDIQNRHRLHLNDAPDFLRYQDGEISDQVYRSKLAEWLALSPEQAVQAHLAILKEDYPGAFELVKELQDHKIHTSCFSNTNAFHWERLCSAEFHPAVATLDAKFASHLLNLAKPLPEAFKAVESQLPPHSRLIFFDDTQVNVTAANECGWTAFLIDAHAPPPNDPVSQMRSHLADLQILPRAV
jgi:FMN phosphatase YigB (HAD superfamily)